MNYEALRTYAAIFACVLGLMGTGVLIAGLV